MKTGVQSMNYPIYNQDRPHKCEEIFRYLQTFPHHIVYISKNFRSKGQQQLQSTHIYPRDGLSIELHWECQSIWIPSKLSTMGKLLRMQEEDLITLVDFKILRFSKSHSLSHRSLLDTATRNLYYSKVLQNTERQLYTQQEYELLEHQVREPSSIPDLFFVFLADEITKAIEFEKYYENEKKKMEE